MDAVWPIISNREALAVNEAWVGDAGVLVKKSDEMLPFTNCHWGFNQHCTHAASMVWKKELPAGKVAVLLMNNRNVTTDVNVSWVDLPPDMQFRCSAAGCPVRDIYAHEDLGFYNGGFTAKDVAPHDSAFVVVQQCVKETTYPFRCVVSPSEPIAEDHHPGQMPPPSPPPPPPPLRARDIGASAEDDGSQILRGSGRARHVPAPGPPTDEYEFVESGGFKVGIDITRGGSIGYMSSPATKGVNVVVTDSSPPSAQKSLALAHCSS